MIKFQDLKKFYVRTIDPFISSDKYGGTTFGILVGIFFFSHHFTRPPINFRNDLTPISGRLTSFSFVDGSRGAYRYYVYLNNYNNSFQIAADFIPYFKKNKFISQAENGSLIQIKIFKQFMNEINFGKNVGIYSLAINNQNVLAEEDTLKRYNSNFEIYAGSGFILFGLCFYLYRRFQKK